MNVQKNHMNYLCCQMYDRQLDIVGPGRNASASLDNMDFHLARLQRMFSTPCISSNFQMAFLGTGEGGEHILELRTAVQRLIERLKAA